MKRLYNDTELLYAEDARCKCGAGLAYPLDTEDAMALASWTCSDVLKGKATGGEKNHDALPFAFYKVREETSINGNGATTRPPGTIARTVGHAKCCACGHEWQSEPYEACGASHHWFAGACPECGNDCGGAGSWSSEDKRPRIDTRYRTVVLAGDAR
jgi:hypothetical protein